MLERVKKLFGFARTAASVPGANAMPGPSSEVGQRSTVESQYRQISREWWVDPELRAAILEIRAMDRTDGRVKRVHSRTARYAAKGGLKLKAPASAVRLHREWERFVSRLQLDVTEKLESDVRGLMMEGNLPLQWVYDDVGDMCAAIRMPSECIVPIVGVNGRFTDPRAAYKQVDILRGQETARFALFQMSMARLSPDNFDDWGCLGRPYLDASREVWKKLVMTEGDMVVRRRMRAPLRMVHTLEGASKPDLQEYRLGVEQDQEHGLSRDYYMNRKGSVAAVQGDAALDQIADVSYLLDSFFAGAPAPKQLFGYVEGLNRDILEDLKIDYFEEIDRLQDNVAGLYERGFMIHLLLKGMNPENMDFEATFAERRTDTPNQRADLALKYQALGVSSESVLNAAGLDAKREKAAIDAQKKERDAYPEDGLAGPPLMGDDDDEDDAGDGSTPPRVSITPGNAPKNESATSIRNR